MPESADNNQPPTQSGRGLVRLRIDLGYDGTNFKGWAIQPDVRTVQAEVEAAITTALRQSNPLTVVVAGRTDAGVHARGQVVHCDVPDDVELDFYKLIRSLNGLTPEDIRIFRGQIAPEGFDARYSAIARRYTYSIMDGARDPIIRSHTVSNYLRLDVDLMNEAASKMVGLNDYSAFCKESEFGTSIRNLQQFSWERTEFGVKATLRADAFCHSMVRALVGSMIPVGEGRKNVDFPINVLSGQERHPLAVTMPPHGLVLEEIYYPPDDQLAARQLETRSTRANTESKSDSWD